jgi:hypothetical protein
MKPIQYIIREYRTQRFLSLRGFAEALSGGTNGDISHQAIKNWEDGVHEPDFQFLVTMALTNRDWRGDFAFDCLAAMRPEFYEPMTNIGREAIEKFSVSKEK